MDEFNVGDVAILRRHGLCVVGRGVKEGAWREVTLEGGAIGTAHLSMLSHPTRDEAAAEAARLTGALWGAEGAEYVTLGRIGRSDNIVTIDERDGSWLLGDGGEWLGGGLLAASLAVIKGVILGEIEAHKPAPVTDDERAKLAGYGMEVDERPAEVPPDDKGAPMVCPPEVKLQGVSLTLHWQPVFNMVRELLEAGATITQLEAVRDDEHGIVSVRFGWTEERF